MKRILLFPITAIAAVLLFLLMFLDKMFPSARIFPSFVVAALSHGDLANVEIVKHFHPNEKVEVLVDLPIFGVKSGQHGSVVSIAENNNYMVELENPDGCIYATITGTSLRKL